MNGPYQKLPDNTSPDEITRPNPLLYSPPPPAGKMKRATWKSSCCLLIPALLILLIIPAGLYFLAPGRTNILVFGIDARPDEGELGRTDTMILTTFVPVKPYIGALSIPRDLWVTVPGHGENRINTAHFFAEAEQPGSGPQAAMDVVRQNFGVNVDYYVRIRFSGFKDVVNALGGVDINIPNDADAFTSAGYAPGVHHLDGDAALAFVRDRETSDDFYRMQRGQIFLKSVWRQVTKPGNLSRFPAALQAASGAVDQNVPLWLWPRLGFALLRLGPDKIDARSINREMVNPFITSGGADVLGPNWKKINPVLMEMFGQ